MITRPPTSRRGWLALADVADLSTFISADDADLPSSFVAAFISLGPKYYVRRLAERYAQKTGFVVVSVRRDGSVPNPITREMNALYAIEFARRQ